MPVTATDLDLTHGRVFLRYIMQESRNTQNIGFFGHIEGTETSRHSFDGKDMGFPLR